MWFKKEKEKEPVEYPFDMDSLISGGYFIKDTNRFSDKTLVDVDLEEENLFIVIEEKLPEFIVFHCGHNLIGPLITHTLNAHEVWNIINEESILSDGVIGVFNRKKGVMLIVRPNESESIMPIWANQVRRGKYNNIEAFNFDEMVKNTEPLYDEILIVLLTTIDKDKKPVSSYAYYCLQPNERKKDYEGYSKKIYLIRSKKVENT